MQTTTGKLNFSIKNSISQQLNGKNDIYWNHNEVEDYSFNLNKFRAKKRFVPTFAYRQLLYDGSKIKNKSICRICKNIRRKSNSIKWPLINDVNRLSNHWFVDFCELFDIEFNNFPYFNKQILICSKKHILFFSKKYFELIFDFMHYSKFKSALMQIEGSGATILDHAHISICDENLPIFYLEKKKCFESEGVNIFKTIDYPGSLYIIQSKDIIKKALYINILTREIRKYEFSYNLYIDKKNTVYIILRKSEFSKHINRKIGSVEAAGIYLGNALGSKTRKVKVLEKLIRNRCDKMTAENFLISLEETVCTRKEGAFVEKVFVNIKTNPNRLLEQNY